MTSIEAFALRCILPGFEGTRAPDWVLQRAADGLGGVILFARNFESKAQMTGMAAELHSASPGLLVCIDEEGGDVTRLEARTGSSYPGNLALGVADTVSLTRDVAAAIGAELAACGIDLNFAPVADVNSNPQNPVIGVRSFGSDAGAVARHTAAYIEGMQNAGVAACAKHFPGHGDTAIDSHLDLPVVAEDPHLRALGPFASAIECGVQSIMSAHVVVPAIDDAPATLSPRIMTGLLRDELGFKGLAVTDGLEMQGLSRGIGIAEGAVQALIAGCDALCIGGGRADEGVVDEIVDAVTAAVARGRLRESRLREAASRVDAVVGWRAAHAGGGIARGDPGAVAARLAILADGAVKVGPDAAVLRFESTPSIAAGDVPWGLAAALAAHGVQVMAIDVDPAAHDPAVLLDQSKGRSIVLVVRDLHRRPDQAVKVDALLAARPDAILVEMGVPICRPERATAYIATHGSARVCAEAAAEVLTR